LPACFASSGAGGIAERNRLISWFSTAAPADNWFSELTEQRERE
jgi:hypothetical protein